MRRSYRVRFCTTVRSVVEQSCHARHLLGLFTADGTRRSDHSVGNPPRKTPDEPISTSAIRDRGGQTQNPSIVDTRREIRSDLAGNRARSDQRIHYICLPRACDVSPCRQLRLIYLTIVTRKRISRADIHVGMCRDGLASRFRAGRRSEVRSCMRGGAFAAFVSVKRRGRLGVRSLLGAT